ncbi:hypothetical protein V2J94_38880 [Streptomyces sp. DSM 41524]|uniref:Secreted protein n=2 Tax=Streptomyces violaceusniger group TaxID=2839105 RepID=A0A6G4AUY7_9ACTN|nr:MULTISPECIES: hypothetical protein [Streptomyces]MEE4597769.1 hypothetical protein [Streptomyces sp. DSM 41524]NEW77286.1 hypothetical protein [Streptomyces rhizosphaericus]TMU94512.1 hypothetical protein FGK60_35380 [Streptomyces sp. DASNCL29]
MRRSPLTFSATTAAAMALVAALATAASAAPTARSGTSSAATCFGSAHSYSKPDGYYAYPPEGDTRILTTTSNCADINIKPNTNRYVMVCFVDTGCPSSYTLTTGGQWNTIETSVPDGTDFWFLFRSSATSNGSWAA